MVTLDRLGWTASTIISTFGIRIGIRANDDAVIAALSGRLPPDWKASRSTSVDRLYSVIRGGASSGSRRRRFHLLYDGAQRLARTRRLDELNARFENSLQNLVALSARRRIFVHAGVVGWRGRAIVMPGRSFSGKTTMVSALLKAGATYYSDEFAVLDERGRVHPYTKALSLRGDGAEPPKKVDAEAFGSIAGVNPLPVGLVVLSRYEPGSRWRPRKLSPGRAVLAVLANTVPARHAPGRSLRTLRKTLARTPALTGRRGDAGELVDLLLNMVDGND